MFPVCTSYSLIPYIGPPQWPLAYGIFQSNNNISNIKNSSIDLNYRTLNYVSDWYFFITGNNPISNISLNLHFITLSFIWILMNT